MTPIQLIAENYQKIAIKDIKLGMFVVAITKQKGDIDFKSGVVSSESTRRSLQSMGVLEVRIDLSRSKHQQEVLIDNPESNLASEEQVQEVLTSTEKTESRKRAQKLYAEAKILQTKLLDALKNGEVVDIAPLEEMADEMIDSIFKNPDAMVFLSRIREKDTYLMEHSLNVGMLLANFGRFLKLSRQTIKELLVGGLLHDTGKIMVPDEILHKPGRLTADEFSIMKRHVEYSMQFLDKSEGISKIMRIVAANHHERLDGLGYPRGLKGLELCLASRMSTIVDVFDALTADRCYKKGMQATQAFRILLQGCGTQFDEKLVKKLLEIAAPTVVYVSCNPATQARDLALLSEKYQVTKIQPVDMFPHTLHIENVVQLKLIN